MSPISNSHYFVTGYPGALAKTIIKRLAHEGARVTMLAPSSSSAAAGRFASRQIGEVQVLKGCAHKIDFGLRGDQFQQLAESVTGILDLELISPLVVESDDGAQGLPVQEFIELACAAPQLELLLSMSGHAVAGDFRGSFAEYDANNERSSRRPLVSNLAQKERILRRFGDELPIVLIRSGWVISGINGVGVCPLVPLVFGLASELFGKVSDQSLMMTPLGALADLVFALAQKGNHIEQRTFHFFDNRQITVGDLKERLSSQARQFIPASFDLHRGAERLLARKEYAARWRPAAFWDAQPWNAKFSNLATMRFCEDEGLPLPHVDDKGMIDLAEQAVEEIGGFK